MGGIAYAFTTHTSAHWVVGHPDSSTRFIFHFRSVPSAAKKTVPRPYWALMASTTQPLPEKDTGHTPSEP